MLRPKLPVLDSYRKSGLLTRFERATEIPLLILALAMIPLLLIPLTVELTPSVERGTLAADWAIWAVFAGELSIRTYLAERRLSYLARHWYDVLIVVLPFFRPLRPVRAGPARRLLEGLRIIPFGVRALTSIEAVAAEVQGARPDLRPHAAPDGVITIMFTDIERSTEMVERFGDRRWLDVLRAHHGMVRQQVRAHDGYEVGSIGDGFMLVFRSAEWALRCAIAIQRAFERYCEEHPDAPLRVRIGLHTGQAVEDEGTFYGWHVHLASRIVDRAKGGEILVSSGLKEIVERTGDFAFDAGRQTRLKGLSGRHGVFRAHWK